MFIERGRASLRPRATAPRPAPRPAPRMAGPLLALGLVAAATPAVATENSGTHYPVGLDTVVSGVLPPPGTYLFNYSVAYAANRLNDSNGDSLIPGFRVRSAVNSVRLLQTWDTSILGANPVSEIVVPLVYAYAENSRRGNQDKFGIGDINLAPFQLAWHSPSFHAYAGPRIFLPTGGYDRNDVVNIGLNYYTIGMSLGMSWFPVKELQIGTKFFYNTNTRNSSTQYRSGNELSMDYVVGYQLNEKFNVGVNGYYYRQLTDDKVNGRLFRDGFKGEVLAVGPTLRYNLTEKVALTVKHQHEVLAYNRPRGDRFWLQFVIPLGTPGERPVAKD